MNVLPSDPRRRLALGVGCGLLLLPMAFSLGKSSAERALREQIAANDTRLATLRDEMALSILQFREAQVSQSSAVEAIKRQLQDEMGLLPVSLLRQRRESFVELNAVDSLGRSSYGTAGYLGHGYFITVKHGVMVLDGAREGEPRRITSITVGYDGRDLAARVIDSGNADVEVHPGDWAIIKVDEVPDLPPLRVNADYAFQFADPIFRLGNDYSKGILLSTGYVGQRTSNGLVTCLTDGHPGASGGGVLDQEGDFVGIPIGRMGGDYRFSFILPLRLEMFANVPTFAEVSAPRDARLD
jgi:S1-C subfamily serine protease